MPATAAGCRIGVSRRTVGAVIRCGLNSRAEPGVAMAESVLRDRRMYPDWITCSPPSA